MQRTIRITIDTLKLTAGLTQTPSADALWEALPLQAHASRWGDEIYFSVPFRACLEEGSRAVVQAGDVAYWPDGPALCFFFGPTPVSRPGEIRAASAVNVCAAIQGDSTLLRRTREGARVVLTRMRV